jgi:hypothetical protein
MQARRDIICAEWAATLRIALESVGDVNSPIGLADEAGAEWTPGQS